MIHEKDTIGVTWMTNAMPAVDDSYYRSYWEIGSFEKRENGYYIIPVKSSRKYKHGIIYQSFVNVATTGRLPKQLDEVASYSCTDNPHDFFRTAISFGNDLQITSQGFLQGFTTIDIGQNRYSGVLPDSYSDTYKTGLKFSEVRTGRVISEIGVKYIHEDGKYTGSGDGLSWLLYPVYFGEKREDIIQLRELNKDKQQSDDLSVRLTSKWHKDDIEIHTDISYNRQWDKWNRNLPYSPFLTGTERFEDTSDFLFSSMFQYEIDIDHYWNRKAWLTANYDFRSSTSRLDRSYQGEKGFKSGERLTRNAHDVSYKLKMRMDSFYGWVGNRHYLSNTLTSKPLHHLLPEVYFTWNDGGALCDLFDLPYYNILSISGNISRSLGETPLIYRNQAVLSTIYKAEKFNSYFNYTDIFFHRNLKPENYLQTDLNLSFNSERIGFFSIRGFYNNTRNFTAPIFENNNQNIRLTNVGRTQHYGYQIEATTYKHWGYKRPFLNVKWQFHRSWNRVVSLDVAEPFIKLAGFEDISTVFAKGQTMGAIYGSSYQRDATGTILKDEAGMPLVDTSLKKIGDPNPDFIMTLFPSVKYLNFQLSAIFEYSHGGDRWNGTNAFLNSQLRSLQFPMQTLNPPDRNGVGEDNIQKATYFRMADLSLHYIFNRHRTFKVGTTVRNLFVVTPYKGADPSSVLFGNPFATGLDLFNQPSTRQYSIHLTFEL